MDDVDAVQAQIARNMLESGDWVTARLDGVAYLEKAPLPYWLMAISYRIFGVHDWSARIPGALATVCLCWVTMRFARWAQGRVAAFYAGLCLSTCVGLYLFTRILIPDNILTLAITTMLFAFLRAIDDDEPRPGLWASLFWGSMAAGVLLKGLIAIVFPVITAALFLVFTGDIRKNGVWRRLMLIRGLLLFLALAAPWHVLAALANPPHFDFTLHSESGSYHGFLWFYFLNEHLFRFLNMRYPRDYNTVPRVLFWSLHLVWLFPWSVYLPAVAKLQFRGADRGSRARLLALCWVGCVLVFFTFSTTQEYYSLPCYPAFALLLGAALSSETILVTWGRRVIGVIATILFALLTYIYWATRGLSTPADISAALSQNPEFYTLSMGHIHDLTFGAFAYLRIPLALAALAMAIGGISVWMKSRHFALVGCAFMMVVFYQAARLALIVFDPYLGSRPLAEALLRFPEGQLIIEDQYYDFSSVVFYSNRRTLLLNGRKMNLEYGSYAPGAPDVFLDDASFTQRWMTPARYYLAAGADSVSRLRRLAGAGHWFVVADSGGKILVTNHRVS